MRAHKLFTYLILSAFFVLMSAPLGAEELTNPYVKPYKDITPSELKAKLEEVEANRAAPFVLIDARSHFRYTAGHLHGARPILWKEMKPGDLPADKGALIVFYCDGPG